MMYSLIIAAVPVDAVNLSELPMNAAASEEVQGQSIGAVRPVMLPRAPYEPQPTSRPAVRRYLHLDESLSSCGHLQVPLERLVDAGSRAFPHAGAQFHLATCKRGRWYLISLYRVSPLKDFSPQERTFLKNFSRLLFPIVESHTKALNSTASHDPRCDATAAPAQQTGRQRLEQRFVERMQRAGVALSAREIEVCTGLLAGDTVPAIAARTALRECTVETYLKRAAIKLGVAGRRGMTRWLFDAPTDEPSACHTSSAAAPRSASAMPLPSCTRASAACRIGCEQI